MDSNTIEEQLTIDESIDQSAIEVSISKDSDSKSDVDIKKASEEEVDGGVLDQRKGILKTTDSSVVVGDEEVVQVGVEDRRRKKKQPRKKLIPVYRLFRFADFWDLMMILIGTIMASLAGLALPGHMLLFGRVINEFVTYSIATSVPPLGNITADSSCSATSVFNSPAFVQYLNTSQAHFCFDSQNSRNDTITLNIVSYACNPNQTLQTNVGLFSVYYVGLATAVLIAIFLATIFWNTSAYRQTRRMRLAFYRSILHQEIGWFDVNEANQLNTRLVDDIEHIQSGIGDKLALFIQYVSTFLAGFVIAFAINWKMALVVSIMLPLLTLMAFLIARVIATYTVREQGAYAAAGAVAEEVLSSIRTVVAFGGERKEAERYGDQLKKARKEGFKKAFFSSIISGLLFFIIFGTYALGFGVGSTLIISCELSAGDIVTVFFSIIIGSFNLGNALPELGTFASALGSATIVYEIIDREPLIDSFAEDGVIPEQFEGNIKLSDVIFHYPARPNVQVLHGLDLEVRKGQTVALVGPSGCGKSTVVQLIQRIYDAEAGQVTIDGQDIKSLNLRWLRKNIGVVSQEPVLFNTTIAENIRYGKEEATIEEVMEAAKKANAHEFISQLPEGYNTDVGERGGQLSGGQKQRIAIARALVKDPKVLLLDEATSALDTESEKVVQDALDKASQGRTTIVIAHRLSTIQTADIIVSIEKGCVVERGSHSDLMDNEGLYFALVTAQTIVDEEEDSQEPLAAFKRDVKRSFSRTESLSKDRPNVSRQTSRQLSQDDVFTELSDHLSRFSVEDIPFVTSPSPHPGHRAYLGPTEHLSGDSDNEESDDSDDEKAVRFENNMVETGSGFSPSKRRPSLAKIIRKRKKKDHDAAKVSFLDLLKLNKPDWPFVLIGVIGSAIMGCLFPLMAIIFSDVLRVFGLPDKQEIMEETVTIVVSFIGLAVGASLVQFVSSYTLSIGGERLTKRLRYLSFQAMLQQEIAWFDKKSNSTGALTTKLAVEASEVKGATGIRVGVLLQQVFGFVAAMAVAFSASWETTLLLMLCFPVLFIVGFFQIKLVSGKAAKNKKEFEAAGQIAVESIDNIRTVVNLGIESRFYRAYKEQLKKPFRNNMQSVFVQAVVLGIAQSSIFYLFAAGYSFGAYLVVVGRTSYDQLFRVFAAVVFTALSIGRASSFAPDASKAKISAARVLGLLNRKPAIDSYSSDGEKPRTADGAVSFNLVHFNYPERPEVKVLQGLSISVKPGQTLALVGTSGCGKSTTVSLLERFYDPVTGDVSLDENNIKDLNVSWLRSKVGIVSQEPVLFDSSIADNIRYGALFRDVSDDEVVEAAKAANIHSFIETLPMGYNSNVGAKGTQLSGGQKQRVAIARALVRDPKVLLLDEATSALDSESEKVVQDALDKASQGRTTIVIAHRLSTIYNSDVIAVIYGGQVLESGTHAELMALGGAYYHLNTVQLVDIE